MGSLSQAERIRLCQDTQDYLFDHLTFDDYCQFGAESNARGRVGPTADDATFQAACATGFTECKAQGEARLVQLRESAKSSCESTTPAVLRSGCSVTLSQYEDCAARQLDQYLAVAASDCSHSTASETSPEQWTEDFTRDCLEPINQACPSA